MNIAQLGCKTMRDGIVVAAVFLGMGLALLAAARSLIPPFAFLPELVSGLGVLTLLLAPVILVGTYARTVARRKP